MRVKKDILNEFMTTHDLRLVTQECGFGEIVTGFIPRKGFMFLNLDKELSKTKPITAYQHCDILAIKGVGIKAKEGLVNWIQELNKNNIKVISLENEGNERQIQETGKTKYVLSLINN